MNFPPFGGHFPSAAIPAIHQFATSGAALVSSSSSTSSPNNNVDHHQRYHHAAASHQVNIPHFSQSSVHSSPILGKFRDDANSMNNKYNNGHSAQYSPYGQEPHHNAHQPQQQQSQPGNDKHRNGSNVGVGGNSTMSSIPPNSYHQPGQGLSAPNQSPDLAQSSDAKRNHQNVTSTSTASSWQSLAPSSAVADYLSHLPASTLPLSLHHFLKYSAENIKKETGQNTMTNLDMSQVQILNPNQLHPGNNVQNLPQLHQQQQQQQSLNQTSNETNSTAPAAGPKKKKKKKSSKPPKERKPRPKPGEIRLTTALDGSTLFCCPECQMAYPERGMLEQHLVGHNLERRFICDICNAALKRKDHLTRHKQSHNPERPFVCTICLKAFKRKEQLTLHFVIHSGEKRHICNECGKGFYRKDHLRKHTRSHIARRVKAELSQQQPTSTTSSPPQQQQQQQPPGNNTATLVVPNIQQQQQQQQMHPQQQQQQQQMQHHNGGGSMGPPQHQSLS